MQSEHIRFALVPPGLKRAPRMRRPSSNSSCRVSTPPAAAPAILIYVSFADAFAEVIADAAVYRR